MRQGKLPAVNFRRKREGRTNYKKRIKMLMPNKPRFVVRATLKGAQASVVEYRPEGDRVLLTINTAALNKLGWKGYNGNLPSAYLIGLLTGKKALEKGIKEAILDLGHSMPTKGSRLYAVLAGAIDAGIKIPFNSEITPKTDRISGEHIAKYAQELKNDRLRYEKQFSSYIKRGLSPEEIVKHFNEIKDKINR